MIEIVVLLLLLKWLHGKNSHLRHFDPEPENYGGLIARNRK